MYAVLMNRLDKYFHTVWEVLKYWVISGPYFAVFGLNTGKYATEITLYLDTFHAVSNRAIANIYFHNKRKVSTDSVVAEGIK